MKVILALMDAMMELVYNQMAKQKKENKKAMAAWIWILIILVILAVIGIIIYFVFAGGTGSSVVGGNSIPQPPALPN